MAFTLAKPSARSNSDCPSARPRPAANPVPELARTVAMQHPGREARGFALAFHADPRHSDVRQRAERRSVEGRTPSREDDHQRFVIHRPHANAAGVSGITVPLRGGAIRRGASGLGVDLGPLQLPGEIHVDHLGLRIEVVDLPPALAMSVAGLLHTAERQVGFGADGGGGWEVYDFYSETKVVYEDF